MEYIGNSCYKYKRLSTITFSILIKIHESIIIWAVHAFSKYLILTSASRSDKTQVFIENFKIKVCAKRLDRYDNKLFGYIKCFSQMSESGGRYPILH
jgi:hypothetical protein